MSMSASRPTKSRTSSQWYRARYTAALKSGEDRVCSIADRRDAVRSEHRDFDVELVFPPHEAAAQVAELLGRLANGRSDPRYRWHVDPQGHPPISVVIEKRHMTIVHRPGENCNYRR
jgi:hypothetical protein